MRKKINRYLSSELLVHAILIVGLLLLSLSWTRHILTAPDESSHVQVVEFYSHHNRLIQYLKDYDETYGPYNTRQGATYAIFPPVSYYVSGKMVQVLRQVDHRGDLLLARTTQTFYFFVFLVAIYLLLKQLKLPLLARVFGLLFVALIPQITFTFSYVNGEAYSLAVCTLTTWYVVRLLQLNARALNWRHGIIFGFLISLCILGRYTFYPFILFISIPILIKVLLGKSVQLYKLLLAGFITVLVLCSWFFIRNYVLFHDFLGLSTWQATVRSVETSHHRFRPTYQAMGNGRIWMITHTAWLGDTFRSFFGNLGGLTAPLQAWMYELLAAVSLVGLGGGIIAAWQDKKAWLMKILVIAMGLTFLTTLALSINNSWSFDFQPQGRYLFAIIPFLIVLLPYGLNAMVQNDRWRKLVFIGIPAIALVINLYAMIWLAPYH